MEWERTPAIRLVDEILGNCMDSFDKASALLVLGKFVEYLQKTESDKVSVELAEQIRKEKAEMILDGKCPLCGGDISYFWDTEEEYLACNSCNKKFRFKE